MPLDLKTRNRYITLFDSETEVATTNPIELYSNRDYTLYCSPPLVGAEVIKIEIYDSIEDTFYQLSMSGAEVKLASNYNMITFNRVGCIIQCVKTITTSPTNLYMVTQ